MNGFLLYAEYKEHFENFENDSDRVELLYAIFDYHSKRETKIISKAVKIAFSFVKKELDRQILKYDSVCERNKANGSKGGRPITQNNPENPVGILGLSNNPEEPKKPNTNSNTNTNSNSKENTNTKEKENINNNIVAEAPTPRIKNKKVFIKPTIEEIKAYIQEKDLKGDGDRFFNYYESNGWRVGKNPMSSWRASLSNWRPDDNAQSTNGKAPRGQYLNKIQRVDAMFERIDEEIKKAKEKGVEIRSENLEWLSKTAPKQISAIK